MKFSRVVPILLALAGFIVAGGASARTETLEWTFGYTGDFDGFEIYVGSSPGSPDQTIDAGLPSVGADGIYRHDVIVPDGATAYFSVAAYRGAEVGPVSNEQRDPPDGSEPLPDPDPGSAPPAGSGSIGFSMRLSLDGTTSSSKALGGSSVPGDALRVFVEPASLIDRVEFYLDDPERTGPPTNSEGSAPYSLGGDSGVNALNAFLGVSLGSHTLTILTLSTSGTSELETVTFEVLAPLSEGSSVPLEPPVLIQVVPAPS